MAQRMQLVAAPKLLFVDREQRVFVDKEDLSMLIAQKPLLLVAAGIVAAGVPVASLDIGRSYSMMHDL